MVCRTLRGESVLTIPPWNLDGLFVRKLPTSANCQMPLGSVSAVACMSIRSTAIRRHRVNCCYALVVIHGFVVEPESDGIDKGRGKAVGFFGRQELPGAEAAKFDVIHAVRGRIRSSIKHVSSVQAVFLRELMIEPSGNKVFVHNLLTRECE